jgi:hypothetical protein
VDPGDEGDVIDREMSRVLERYRDYAFPPGPVALSDEYRALIEAEEGHPDNATGSDKTWVQAARRSFRRFARSVE